MCIARHASIGIASMIAARSRRVTSYTQLPIGMRPPPWPWNETRVAIVIPSFHAALPHKRAAAPRGGLQHRLPAPRWGKVKKKQNQNDHAARSCSEWSDVLRVVI